MTGPATGREMQPEKERWKVMVTLPGTPIAVSVHVQDVLPCSQKSSCFQIKSAGNSGSDYVLGPETASRSNADDVVMGLVQSKHFRCQNQVKSWRIQQCRRFGTRQKGATIERIAGLRA